MAKHSQKMKSEPPARISVEENVVGEDDRLVSARERFSVAPNVTGLQRFLGLTFFSIASGLILLSFILFVRSFWIFTHPNLSFDLPKMPNFQIFYDNPGQQTPTKLPPDSSVETPSNPIPSLNNVSQSAILDFLNQISEGNNALADKMTKNELVDTGNELCQSFHKHFLWMDHQFTKNQVLSAFLLSMYSKYPLESGIRPFATVMLDASVKNLCPENQS